MIIIEWFKKFGYWIKDSFLELPMRLKPRFTFSWIFSVVLWLIVLLYIGFGIFTGFEVYQEKSESNFTKTAVKFYPLPAATVNGGVIWAKSYYQQLNYIRQFSSKTKQAFPDETSLRKQIIDQLVEGKILEMQAVRYHVRVTNKDVNDAYQKIVDQSGGVTEVKKVLTELYGMSEGDFKVLVRQQVVREKIQNEVIAQVKVSHILIKDEGRANDVAARAKKGEDFAALAKEFTEDSKSKDAGGELGWLAKGQLVVSDTNIPEFDKAAFDAKKGDIVGPVKTSIGFEIIKVEDKKGQVSENFDSWLAGLKKQAKIWQFIK